MGAVRKAGNSLGIKPLSETLTGNNLANLLTNPTGMAGNAISRAVGGSGNAGKDLGLGNSLTGTSSQDIINRAGAAALGAGAGYVALNGLGGLTGSGATAGEAAGAASGGGVIDWANKISKDTDGSGSAGTDIWNGVKDNAGQLIGGGAGIYNSNQQGQAANDIAQQQMALQKPYYDAGTNSLAKMMQGVTAYQADPYNQWLTDQGSQTISRSAAAKGMGNSGNVLAELAKYGQGMAGQGYKDWFNQQGTIASYGAPAASNMGNAYATGRQGTADANSGATSAALNTLNNIMNNPTQNTAQVNQQYTNPYDKYLSGNQSWQTPGINGNVNTNYNPNAYVNPNVTTDFSQYLPKNY